MRTRRVAGIEAFAFWGELQALGIWGVQVAAGERRDALAGVAGE